MPAPLQAEVDTYAKSQLDRLNTELQQVLGGDVVGIFGVLSYGLEDKLRDALESIVSKKTKLAVVLDTPGGIVQVAERMVKIIRHFYNEVIFIIPNMAMSAGTVFAMSGDIIMMDYFSTLGPIDPQVYKAGKLIPALSYLIQYKRLVEKSATGSLTTAEMVMLKSLDLAELHSFEEARELSIALLEEWLATYKFKDWNKTETNGNQVTPELRKNRAREVAEKLCDNERWHSHGRPISMDILRKDINLKIDDFSQKQDLSVAIRKYYRFLKDYFNQGREDEDIVHAINFCR